MKVAIFSAKKYDREFFTELNSAYGYELHFYETHLDTKTVELARGADVVCVFVSDCVDREVLSKLKDYGIKLLCLRCAGFNNVDMKSAEEFAIEVKRVPEYSPYAIAEHTLALILCLNRKIHKAYNRVRESNFSLEGLMGFDIHGKTIGVIGTGKIGEIFVRLLGGFGVEILAYDPCPRDIPGISYVSLDELYSKADIVSLHCPLTDETRHLIDADAINKMKDTVMLVNTSRGAVLDTKAVVDALKSGKIGSLALDVYEEEDDVFFEDLSGSVIQDDLLMRLLSFPNVLLTSHQAFFTKEALTNIVKTFFENIHQSKLVVKS